MRHQTLMAPTAKPGLVLAVASKLASARPRKGVDWSTEAIVYSRRESSTTRIGNTRAFRLKKGRFGGADRVPMWTPDGGACQRGELGDSFGDAFEAATGPPAVLGRSGAPGSFGSKL